jgi:hypothetical protein
MSYEKKYILIFHSSLKHERRVVILRVHDMPGELSFFEFEIWEENCRSWVWGMRGELSFFNFEIWEESIRSSSLKYSIRVVVLQIWGVPYELSFCEFEECQLVKFRFQFVPTIADNWLFDIKQCNNIVINTTGVTYTAGAAYPTRALEFTNSFSGVRA